LLLIELLHCRTQMLHCRTQLLLWLTCGRSASNIPCPQDIAVALSDPRHLALSSSMDTSRVRWLMVGAGRRSSSSLSKGRAIHCTLGPVLP
jgi:hypothetical protein